MAKTLKDIKKGDKVYLKGFTGMRLGEFEVIAANSKQFKVAKKDGTQMTFDKATGKQTDASNEKYANLASVDKPVVKEKVVKEKVEKVEKAPKAKGKGKNKKVEPEPEPEEEEDFDEDEDFEDELEDDDDDFEDEE